MGILDAVNRDVRGLVDADRFSYGGKARILSLLETSMSTNEITEIVVEYQADPRLLSTSQGKAGSFPWEFVRKTCRLFRAYRHWS